MTVKMFRRGGSRKVGGWVDGYKGRRGWGHKANFPCSMMTPFCCLIVLGVLDMVFIPAVSGIVCMSDARCRNMMNVEPDEEAYCQFNFFRVGCCHLTGTLKIGMNGARAFKPVGRGIGRGHVLVYLLKMAVLPAVRITERHSIDGYLEDWSNWSTCSQTCSSGLRTRSRACIPPQYGGAPCSQNDRETQQCMLMPCPACYDVLGRDCFRYKDTDCVGPFETWARMNCSLRCGYCPQKLPCVDNLDYCNEFGMEVCHQEQYGQYMREHCRKFCNFCRAPTEYLVSSTLPTTTPGVENNEPVYDATMKFVIIFLLACLILQASSRNGPEKGNSADDENDPNTNNEKDDDSGNRNSVDPMAYIIKRTN
uniref:Brain-specific angiogenesis inhibitor 1 n=1 Tax=Magallana gigas TaxID=29159 RepID=K1R8F1_MAGGI